MSARNSAYESYKDSGVDWLGDVPREWNTKRAKFIFQEINKRSVDGSEELLSVSEYYGVKPRASVKSADEFLSRAESLEGYKKCSENDLVMNIMLAWKRGLGFSKYDGIVSPAYSVFRANQQCCPNYLHYLLRTDTYADEFKRWSTGIIDSRLRLYPESFGNVSILLPSLEEQRAIALFLDRETGKIDELIARQERMIELLKEKRQAVISHAVTKGLDPNAPMKDSGNEWLGEVPAHWDVRKIKYLSTLLAKKVEVDGRQIVALENIEGWRGNYIETESEYTGEGLACRSGDVLFGKLRPYLCKVFHCLDDYIAFGDLLAYRPQRDVESRFIFYTMLSEWFIFIVDGSTYGAKMPRANPEFIHNMQVVAPPSDEQGKIVEFLDYETTKIDCLIAKAEQAIELMKERRTALISAAVTGKIDVREGSL